MQDETIYKLVTMLGDARAAETELRRENTILQDRFYAFSKANDNLMRALLIWKRRSRNGKARLIRVLLKT